MSGRAAWLVRFRAAIVETDLLLLGFAVLSLGASLVADAALEPVGLPIWVEDFFKYVGLAAYASWCFSAARGLLQSALARGQAAPEDLRDGLIAKADGDAPVQAYIAAMPGWKRDVGRRLDALIVRTVPGVRKAVKWNSPLYGVEGQGWFLGIHVFTNYLKVAFFRGTSLRPVPPASPSRRTCATSTSRRTTSSTKLNSSAG